MSSQWLSELTVNPRIACTEPWKTGARSGELPSSWWTGKGELWLSQPLHNKWAAQSLGVHSVSSHTRATRWNSLPGWLPRHPKMLIDLEGPELSCYLMSYVKAATSYLSIMAFFSVRICLWADVVEQFLWISLEPLLFTMAHIHT